MTHASDFAWTQTGDAVRHARWAIEHRLWTQGVYDVAFARGYLVRSVCDMRPEDWRLCLDWLEAASLALAKGEDKARGWA